MSNFEVVFVKISCLFFSRLNFSNCTVDALNGDQTFFVTDKWINVATTEKRGKRNVNYNIKKMPRYCFTEEKNIFFNISRNFLNIKRTMIIQSLELIILCIFNFQNMNQSISVIDFKMNNIYINVCTYLVNNKLNFGVKFNTFSWVTLFNSIV